MESFDREIEINLRLSETPGIRILSPRPLREREMRLAWIIIGGASLACSSPDVSYGQSGCAILRPVTVSGIVAAITRTTLQKDLLVQFVVTNRTPGRVYLKSAQWDDSARASLDSGIQVFKAVASGVETTQGASAAGCMGNPVCSQDLSTYSEVDPGQSLRFTYKFSSMSPMSEDDKISLSANFIARLGHANGDREAVGQAKPVRFPFSSIPFGC